MTPIRVTDRFYCDGLEEYNAFTRLPAEEQRRIIRSLPDPRETKGLLWHVPIWPKIPANPWRRIVPETVPEVKKYTFEKMEVFEPATGRRFLVWRLQRPRRNDAGR